MFSFINPRIVSSMLLIVLIGCSSAEKKPVQQDKRVRGAVEIWVETKPSGAAVKFEDGQECISPCSITTEHQTDLKVVIEKKGCKTYKTILKASESNAGAMTGMIFAGILGGGAVKGAFGNAGRMVGSSADGDAFKPNPLKVSLACNPFAQ